ncbi:unnamed protein product [Cladocopium goreaui]|uniref:N(6)-L-threonylcarbamoyladenine synthase n=1 Tax=Cladocopium goreaui TaxID=2562237 RepID=A0A9P1CVC5_9DINO|nr:unnamed protein product [Cladocopium goreaui]
MDATLRIAARSVCTWLCLVAAWLSAAAAWADGPAIDPFLAASRTAEASAVRLAALPSVDSGASDGVQLTSAENYAAAYPSAALTTPLSTPIAVPTGAPVAYHYDAPTSGWGYELLPDGLIYRSYLAGPRESRMALHTFHNESVRNEALWEATLGGRRGIIRYGNGDAANPVGWQIDIEGAAQVRLNLDEARDVDASDFRFGVPFTYTAGDGVAYKFGYYHVSSHLGDEFILRNGNTRINYVRDAIVAGVSYQLNPCWRVYGETAFAFFTAGGAQPWEFQIGAEYARPGPTGFAGTPFFATNAHLREETDFGGDWTVQTGWLWRGVTGSTFRLGLHYMNGKSTNYQFFNQFEEQLGFGIWYNSTVLRLLTIESTCDETAAAVVTDGLETLGAVVASQTDLHERFGGVVPEIASRAHVERILPVVDEALRQAGLTLADLDAIAVANRPGLVGSLLVGVAAAKALCVATGLPLIAVNHLQAHVYACKIASGEEVFPCVGLIVSGGHTNLYRCDGPTDFTPLGGTIDDAAGEAFDKVGAMLGLPFPGGPAVSKAAAQGDRNAIRFPRPLLDDSGRLAFSFSGLKTAVRYRIESPDAERDTPLSEAERNDIAAGFEEAVVDCLVGKSELALRQAGFDTLCVGGGVAANGRLRERLGESAEKHGYRLYIPPMSLCTDNAVMGAIAVERFRAGKFESLDLDVHPGLERIG